MEPEQKAKEFSSHKMHGGREDGKVLLVSAVFHFVSARKLSKDILIIDHFTTEWLTVMHSI